jgi:hypothetical protein
MQNPHSKPEFATIAEESTVLRCLVGSTVHGTAVEGQDDRDEMSVIPHQLDGGGTRAHAPSGGSAVRHQAGEVRRGVEEG